LNRNPHPTAEEIEAARTEGGGWTRAQLAVWGVPWPPPHGWKQRLVAPRSAAGPRKHVTKFPFPATINGRSAVVRALGKIEYP
jgi:hypothetical protein